MNALSYAKAHAPPKVLLRGESGGVSGCERGVAGCERIDDVGVMGGVGAIVTRSLAACAS